MGDSGLVSLLLRGKSAPVGDFTVVRALPQVERRLVGPFCFVDHMGPHTAVGTVDGGVPPHPHIGLATVTWLFEGAVLHRDSLGTEQRITPGDVNWMTAGRGIVHSERAPSELLGKPSTMHGLQVWVALPADQEECEPAFQHVPKAELPRLEAPGVTASVVVGEWGGRASPVRVASPTFYVVAELEAGATLDLEARYAERAVYVVEGAVGLDGTSVAQHELAVLTPKVAGCVTALKPSRVAIFGGEPLEGPRFMLWNFVSSRRERLEQALLDWAQRRFPLVPGDEHARVPGPGER